MIKLMLMIGIATASLVIAGVAADEYIGNLSSNPYNSNSTSNPYGAGNRYNSDSVNNPYGNLGVNDVQLNTVYRIGERNGQQLYIGWAVGEAEYLER